MNKFYDMCVPEKERHLYLAMDLACNKLLNVFEAMNSQSVLTKEQQELAVKMHRTFNVFIERHDHSSLFDSRDGADFDLLHYEHFVLINDITTQEQLKYIVNLFAAFLEDPSQLSQLDEACERHRNHGAILDCTGCRVSIQELKNFFQEIQGKANSEYSYHSRNC